MVGAPLPTRLRFSQVRNVLNESDTRASMRNIWLVLVLLLASVTAASCEVIGDIFQAGFWVGTIVVVVILLGVGFLVSRFRR
jgi:hypothetical protein